MKKLPSLQRTLRFLLLLGATIIISLCLPGSNTVEYSYSLGKPWTYSLLTAPFDIPIELDSASMHSKRDSIDRTFTEVYRIDREIAEKQIANFTSSLDAAKCGTALKNRLVASLNGIYDTGIVDNTTYSKITSGELPHMRTVVDNVSNRRSTDGMKSIKSAYSYMDSIAGQSNYILREASLSEYLTPNVYVDTDLTQKLRESEYQKALTPIGLLQKGERIVDRGEIITLQTFTILNTYNQMLTERDTGATTRHYPMAGKVMVIVIIFASVYGFLYLYRWKFFADLRKVTFLMTLLTTFTVFALLVARHAPNGLYVLPFAMVPVLLTTFFDSRTALYAHIHEVMMCALVATFPIEFVFLQLMAGVTAIFSLRELAKRAQLMRSAAFVFLSYCLSYIAFDIMKEGLFSALDPKMFIYFAINTVLLSLSYILIFVIERVFGFISTVTLVELLDVNNPLLRELSEECPGTFQHSMQVSNLAAEAARKVHANVQLIRAGALYHDIGKMSNPAFFTENQHGVNPHTSLLPEQSADIVISHVRDGLRLAEKAKLPGVICDFISQHHGTGRAKYFYTMACNNAHEGVTVDPKPYTYPGPNPTTKETTILMMADSVEAASRSLTEHTDDTIRALVNKIVDGQIADGLYIDSPLSFRDIEAVKQSFIERLKTIYHTRISYPELRNAQTDSTKK